MVGMDIGQKVATLPVLAFACGIGVDYGIYSYTVVAAGLRKGLSLEEAYYQKMRSTGKATLFTGIGLSVGVALWIFSGLQFQRDMGVLLVFGFFVNRSEEHTSELQSLMRISYAVFCLKKNIHYYYTLY